MPKRGIHGNENSDCHCGIPAGVVNEYPPCNHNCTERASVSPIAINAIQRGTLLPKRSVCQHSSPPIKGINISQGNSMACRSLLLCPKAISLAGPLREQASIDNYTCNAGLNHQQQRQNNDCTEPH